MLDRPAPASRPAPPRSARPRQRDVVPPRPGGHLHADRHALRRRARAHDHDGPAGQAERQREDERPAARDRRRAAARPGRARPGRRCASYASMNASMSRWRRPHANRPRSISSGGQRVLLARSATRSTNTTRTRPSTSCVMSHDSSMRGGSASSTIAPASASAAARVTDGRARIVVRRAARRRTRVNVATRRPRRSTARQSPSGTGATPASRPSGPAMIGNTSARSSTRARERADLRARIDHRIDAREVAGERHAPGARLERRDAAAVRGITQAAAGVAAQPDRRAARRDDRRLAAAALAGRARDDRTGCGRRRRPRSFAPAMPSIVLPSMTPPAARMRATTVASRFGTKSRRSGMPAAQIASFVSIQSFTVNGTPCSGPAISPRASASSSSRARCRARAPPSSCTTAFSFGFTASMRRRCASTTSARRHALLAYRLRERRSGGRSHAIRGRCHHTERRHHAGMRP